VRTWAPSVRGRNRAAPACARAVRARGATGAIPYTAPMSSRRIARWIRWATLCALLVATAAPATAQALRHWRGDATPWSPLCSAGGGMRRIQWLGDSAPGQPVHAFVHCAACALHLDAAAPPLPPATVLARSDLAHARPVPHRQVLIALPTWRDAQPRAPPRLA